MNGGVDQRRLRSWRYRANTAAQVASAGGRVTDWDRPCPFGGTYAVRGCDGNEMLVKRRGNK